MSEYFRRIDIALSEHKMPAEYDDTFSHIYCNDCEKRSFAKYHFIYHKCGYCRGYNTKLLSTQVGLPQDAVIAPEVHIQGSPQEVAQARNPDALERLASSSSLLSANQSHESDSDSYIDSDFEGIWCHNCEVCYFDSGTNGSRG
jgi:hypothetical protein